MIITLQTLLFFRQSLLAAIGGFFRPYFQHFLTFSRNGIVSEEDESDDQVYAEYDDDKGVVFSPPVYAQRYAAVSDCLMDERWCGKLEKVVEFGYHDISFIKYLKDLPGIKKIIAIDLEKPLSCSLDLLGCETLSPVRESQLDVTLFQGNAADPDYRLIGCDAVIAIEMIEHMLPHDLERLVHTIFGFTKPWVAVITTPNGDFNVLFKALEKNGLRRMDHFFEWSRAQFNDWCSNIVARYPQYNVSTRGVGPGPPGTEHLGSCSQLALFVSNDYHKQKDLDLNSLALVAKAPSNTCDTIEPLDSIDTLHNSSLLCLQNDIESYTELVFSNKQSCVTIVLSPSFSFESLEYQDKTSQCNLDTEAGKNFLMFDEGLCFDIVEPRRRWDSRVYLIGDLNSRLNCTTLQVKKFSKQTQNLLAKNKIDSVVQTKQVIDEIRNLTKMLNFSNLKRDNGVHTWNNINWGADAPYWNQYYTVVKEYNYPLEVKSDEVRILDLITDEINRLVDTQYDEDFSTDVDRLEIPIEHLMRIVQHITDDVNIVKDLLEWNGYTVSGDTVIHSRLQLETAPAHEDDWQDENLTDWDTDVRSSSFLDTGATDHYGRCLYRAIDQKVQKIKNTDVDGRDISKELDLVLCRLMKLSLRAARRHQRLLPGKWMQCKLLDLLTLMEKAILKKKQHDKEMPLKEICYEEHNTEVNENLNKIQKFKEDDTADKIFSKYDHLVTSDIMSFSDTTADHSYDAYDDYINKKFYYTLSNELYVRSPSLVDVAPVKGMHNMYFYEDDLQRPRTKAWLDEDITDGSYTDYVNISMSGDIKDVTNKVTNKNKKRRIKDLIYTKEKYFVIKKWRQKVKKKFRSRKNKTKDVDKRKAHICLMRAHVKKKLLLKNCSKKITAYIGNFILKPKKSIRITKLPSSPISEKLSEPYRPNTPNEELMHNFIGLGTVDSCELSSRIANTKYNNIANTKESLFIDIITEDYEETIALRRTIGINVDNDHLDIDNDMKHGSMTNVLKIDSFYNKENIEPEKVHSQTLFIYDLNEPSTSKGIRHVSMDAQCGSGTGNYSTMLSSATSFTKLPKVLQNSINIDDDKPGFHKKIDFGTSTNDNESDKLLSPRIKPVGITIKDSDTIIVDNIEKGIMTNIPVSTDVVLHDNCNSTTDTTLIKAVSSKSKVEDSESEFCGSVSSSRKSHFYLSSLSKNTSDFQMKSVSERSGNGTDGSAKKTMTTKYVRPKLCCGGVYIHSYKDRQASEDVIYQGEWQRYQRKTSGQKRGFNQVTTKRISEACCQKQKTKSKEKSFIKDSKPLPMKRLPVGDRNLKLRIQEKGGVKKEFEKNDRHLNKNKIKITSNHNKNVVQAGSKSAVTKDVLKSNNSRPSYLTKKPSVTFSTVKDEDIINTKLKKKIYIPIYLRKKLLKKNVENIQYEMTNDEYRHQQSIAKPIKFNADSATEEIKADLFKFDPPPGEYVSYVVFRNEIDTNKNSSTDCESPINMNKTIGYTNNINKRSPSSQSLYSSTGSSHNSIATVKVRPTTNLTSDRKYCVPSNTNIQNKNKKYTKKYKDTKKIQENKENLPESSKILNDSDTLNKASFLKNKNVFRARITTDQSPQSANMSRHIPQLPNKSNPNTLSTLDINEKSSIGSPPGPSLSKQPFLKSQTCLTSKSNSAKDIAVSNRQSQVISISENSETQSNINDNVVLNDWIDNTFCNIDINNTSNIRDEIRLLLEERLDFISTNKSLVDPVSSILGDGYLDNSSISQVNSSYYALELVESSNEHEEEKKCSFTYSQMMECGKHFFQSVESSINESVISISNTVRTETDLEMLPFVSVSSTSGISEFCLAESTLSNVPNLNETNTPNKSSVRDLFERKLTLPFQNPPSNLASQAFSGFSMNVERLAGDQADHVNLIDSETGSGLRVGRQTTSEEVFVSGRSSESFGSCLVGEDIEVPHWLFEIISRQQSVEEDENEESEDNMTIELPVVEPLLDMNGNMVEPALGVSAGAGDGRGIHSDNSQDSSGRGTSLSSSASSSGPQSEAIIIDPTAFTAHYDLLRDTGSSSIILQRPLIPVDVQATTQPPTEGTDFNRSNEVENSSGDPQRAAVSLMGASDVEADISSVDTDFPDSSDD